MPTVSSCLLLDLTAFNFLIILSDMYVRMYIQLQSIIHSHKVTMMVILVMHANCHNLLATKATYAYQHTYKTLQTCVKVYDTYVRIFKPGNDTQYNFNTQIFTV